ncbi:30S ribosomal protein S12 methylthiotransferase RimO [Candidatus Acidulodesulfobacterium sp. H_13]|uniref:30S ribosomal protein S12 methylthiotransferase RimO n=1 Tax=Candidatus Acidulodesulfobacterium sp. H_13 TaxID=3395470 RepID=UPI003AF95E10
MSFSFNLISLGCPKNQVDSEEMFTGLKNIGIKFVDSSDACDVCVINTCGFIEAARKESIGVIMEVIQKKQNGSPKYIVVTGCMVNSNLAVLKDELPEVDLFLPTFDEHKIVKEIAALSGKKNIKKNSGDLKKFEREHFNLERTAYIKISEGCNRTCSFCTIPSIRGRYKSRPIDEIKREAEYLAQAGVKELIIVSQDSSCYGMDLNIKNGLYKLLRELVRVKDISWIRILYLYPKSSLFTNELISIIRDEEKILKYIDMPIQHISGNVLNLMKRGDTERDIDMLIQKLRDGIENITLRTSLIVGFPGETDSDFEKLLGFVKNVKFDNMGVFKYSDEKGTLSFEYPAKFNGRIKNERYRLLMETQKGLLPEILSKHVGKTYNAIIDEVGDKTIKARTYFQSPDVDGCTYLYTVNSNDGLEIKLKKRFLPVKITKIKGYDLLGTYEALKVLTKD